MSQITVEQAKIAILSEELGAQVSALSVRLADEKIKRLQLEQQLAEAREELTDLRAQSLDVENDAEH